jgi:hypothetical protein
MGVFFGLVLWLACAAVAAGQTALPAPPAASIVDVSPAGKTFSEPSIAINPLNPDQVVVVYQVGAYAAYSTDSGKSFRAAEMSAARAYRIRGDVSTTFDSQGHAFLCYLAFDHLGTANYWAHGASRNGIYVRRSLDGGKTWEKSAIAIKDFPTGHEAGLEFEDQARIFADAGKNSPYAGNLYAGWIEWQIDQSIILFSRSTDDGRTWSPAVRISTHAGLPRDDNGSVSGFFQTIAPDGTIYAIWHDGNWITGTESHDGGGTFLPSHPIIETAPPYFGEVTGVYRVGGFPQIAMDPKGETLYICWSDYRNGDIDVFIAKSLDRGKHWSRPVRVNDDPLHDGRDQFLQWMAVDPITGAVYVQFYDRRRDPANTKMGFTLARSTDEASTFTNYAWTGNEFEGKGAFLGDYTWLTAYGNRVFGAWTEARPEVKPQSTQGDETEGLPRVSTVIRVGTADFSTLR